MGAGGRWTFPLPPSSDLDRHLLNLCAPAAVLPPRWVNPERLLERALALDVFPLAFHRLRQSPRGLPKDFPAEWEQRFRANAARNLFLHSEQQRLLTALAAAEVRAAPLKGTTLAEQAYGDLALRTQVDIDLYVSNRQLPLALRVLEADGYQRVTSVGLTPEQLAATGDEFTSECSLRATRAAMPVLLELHWRLLPSGERELEALAAGQGLPRELSFLYLCLQCSADRWGTLKTLADLAHWLRRQPPEWEHVLRLADRFRLRRILYITLAALQTYFDLPVLAAVRARLESARPRRLPPAAVANPFAPPVSLSPATTHRLRLALRDGFGDRLRYAAHLLRPTPEDLAAMRLPHRLGFLHWGVRWLRAAGLVGRGPIGKEAVVPE